MKNKATPILDRLILEGIVWVEVNTYVGKAADGVTVSLGCDKDQVERYLTANPSPSDW